MPIEVRDVTHIYSAGMPYEVKALSNISFTVNDGDFLGQKGEQKGSNAQPAPKDQQSTNGKSAPSRSTTGQGSRERSSQPGMSDQNSSGQNERPRRY
jgi:hypothetical protein